MTRPEILAPGGDRETLEAAVSAGADAVYFGFTGFNARARADNAREEDLGERLRYLHERGVKGYVALNTLVFDAELPAFERAVRACAEAGADAIIVQDLGAARLARALAPSLPLHASTQMTCTDAASVEVARELGASRVILARELSLADIRSIGAQTDVELEVFVHGALCVAYSGQCLTSEAIGGRSANRGACAQACRLPYELVVDGELRDTGERAYLLSPEDLESSAEVPELMRLGVVSLKIEGRLKGAAYVAATTRLYREAVEQASGERDASPSASREVALATFSRGSGPGFLRGVDHQRLVEGRACDHRGLRVGELLGVERARGRRWLRVRAERALRKGDGVLVEGGREGEGELGGRVWELEVRGGLAEELAPGAEGLVWLGPRVEVGAVAAGRRLFRTDDPRAERAALAAGGEPRLVPLDVVASGGVGSKLVLEASLPGGERVRLETNELIQEARERPTDLALLRDKLGRLGGTRFELRALASELGPRAVVPPAALNRARRALVERLAAVSVGPRHAVDAPAAVRLLEAAPPLVQALPPGLFVLSRTLEQARAALEAGADGVHLDFLELVGLRAAAAELRARYPAKALFVAPPRIQRPGEERVATHLLSLEPDGVLVRSLGHQGGSSAFLEAARGGVALLGDFSLNVANRLTANEVLGRGLRGFTPSFDLDATQLERLLQAPGLAALAELVVHHPMPLFHMEHCVFAAELSSGHSYADCGRPCDKHELALRDRAGMEHPVQADVGCRNTVFHAASQSAASVVSAAKRAGVARFRVELVRERAADVERLVVAYRELLDGRLDAAAVFSALRAEGRYGVVRGSLRVLG